MPSERRFPLMKIVVSLDAFKDIKTAGSISPVMSKPPSAEKQDVLRFSRHKRGHPQRFVPKWIEASQPSHISRKRSSLVLQPIWIFPVLALLADSGSPSTRTCTAH